MGKSNVRPIGITVIFFFFIPLLTKSFFVESDIVPFREPENYSSSTSRDPFILYPYWNIRFYFKEEISRISGIDVGIWGDTGEISYCSIFGFHSILGPLDQEETSNQQEDKQELEEQKQPTMIEQTTLPATVALVTALAVITAIAFRKKRKNNHCPKEPLLE